MTDDPTHLSHAHPAEAQRSMDRGLRWAVNCASWAPTKQEWLCGLSLVQPEEADRISKFVFRRDAKLALVGRLLMRAGLADLLQIRPTHLQFVRGKKGKPLLASTASISIDESVGFNVSHQGDYSVFAANRGSEVGVDVMQLSCPRGESIPSFFQTMERQFTDREWQQIKSPHLSHQQQLHNFYRFWCLKESYIKAEGSGLSFGLKNLEFIVAVDENWPPLLGECCIRSRLYIKGLLAPGEWVFEESLVDPQHCVSVAVRQAEGEAWRVREAQFPQTFLELTTQDLLSRLTPSTNPPTSHLLKMCEQFMAKKESPNIDNS